MNAMQAQAAEDMARFNATWWNGKGSPPPSHQLAVSTEPASHRKSTGEFREIKKAVADYYGITMTDLCNGGREIAFSHPRQVAFAVIRRVKPGVGLSRVGLAFGGRDHTTVISGLRAVDARADPDEIEAIEKISKGVVGGVFRSTRTAQPIFRTTRNK